MRTLLTCIVTVLLVNLPGAVTLAQTRRISEQELRQLMVSADQRMREEAIEYILREVAPPQRTPELERALADELARLNELVRNRREADRARKPLGDDFPQDYYRDVAEAVAPSSHPIVVPALVGALGTGGMVRDALVKFGEEAVPQVLEIARSKVGLITRGAPGDIPPHVVADALATLQLLLEQAAEPLSPQSRTDITTVALARLTGKQEGEVVIAACQLAIATRDPVLRARVEQLANNRAELVAMGVAESRWIGLVQKVARESLERK